MKKTLISLGSVTSLALPALALAATLQPKLGGAGSYFGELAGQATSLLQKILIFLISLSVVWFIWNIVKYSMSSDEEAKGKAKDQMIHGIIAIAVTVSVWGLVHLLQNAFGLQEGTTNFSGDLGGMIPGGSSAPAIDNSAAYQDYRAGERASY